MKFVFIILVLFMTSCSEEANREVDKPMAVALNFDPLDIPDIEIDKSELTFNAKNSVWSFKDHRFSGFAVSFFQDSTLKQKFGILDGKKQNEDVEMYQDGHVKRSANYHNGRLQGAKKAWSADSSHVLMSSLNYHLGKLHGVQKKWYPTGEIFKILNLYKGEEKGLQQAFRLNGDLFANYEAREGRIFGLKRAALCFGLDDESIQYAK